jgi:RimJ/RimL family protein N-acetyltransferase
MDIATSLYTGKLVRLTRIEFEKDPEVLAEWSKDATLGRMLYQSPVRPLSAWQVKKQLEKTEKEVEEEKNLFYYHIRSMGDENLVGWGKIEWILWPSQSGYIRLAIGPSEQNKGYGSDAMQLLLRFTFDELNLHRLSAMIPDYNQSGIHLLKKFGFAEEVRRREVIFRDGCRWDSLHFGLLCSEWEGRHE